MMYSRMLEKQVDAEIAIGVAMFESILRFYTVKPKNRVKLNSVFICGRVQNGQVRDIASEGKQIEAT